MLIANPFDDSDRLSDWKHDCYTKVQQWSVMVIGVGIHTQLMLVHLSTPVDLPLTLNGGLLVEIVLDTQKHVLVGQLHFRTPDGSSVVARLLTHKSPKERVSSRTAAAVSRNPDSGNGCFECMCQLQLQDFCKHCWKSRRVSWNQQWQS
jgi:hypothetical protein